MLSDEAHEDYYSLRFDGVRRLYGAEAPQRLQSSRVVVVGLGGVGSWAVEALARSGVGSLVLIDLDEICISNTNRQLHALQATVGKSKARVLASRVGEINPECSVIVREEWLLEGDAHALLSAEAAEARERGQTLAVLDAVDGYLEKAAMVDAAVRLNVHIVLAGAAGGKADPTLVCVADLIDVTNDALLRQVRKKLRRDYGFPAGTNGWHAPQRKKASPSSSSKASSSKRKRPVRWGVPCVMSDEISSSGGGQGAAGTLCDRFGTACFATGAFGFAAAAHLTAALARGESPPKRPRIGTAAPPAEDGAIITDDDDGDSEPATTPVPVPAVEKPRDGDSESTSADADESVAGAAAAAPLALFDSHCHAIADAAAYLEGEGCAGVCLMSCGESDWPAAATAGAASAPSARYALGVHPWYAGLQPSGWQSRLREALLAHPAAAVGEAGIDRARLDCPWEKQVEAFTAQLRLASELRRTLVVHSVRCDGALLDLLRAEAAGGRSQSATAAGSSSADAGTPSPTPSPLGLPPRIVMHAYGGSAETAMSLLHIGQSAGSTIFFGFSNRAARLKRAPAVMAAVPADRLLIESDQHTVHEARVAVSEACERVAAARSWTSAEAAMHTAQNARAAFAVDA